MGRLIAVVGNAGVGKTTLTHLLCQHSGLHDGLEQHARPFQALFAADHERYALANQLDYLLLRAEQERAIRQHDAGGIVDGGLDVDFWVFSRYFAAKNYLSAAEWALCERLYRTLRHALPPPDLVIHLVASLDVVAKRHRRRNRALEIAQTADLAALDALLHAWLVTLDPQRILTVDASADDPTWATALPTILARIADRGSGIRKLVRLHKTAIIE